MCASMCAHVYGHVRQADNNNLMLLTLFWHKASHSVELDNQTRLTGQQTLEIYLLLCPQHWNSKPPPMWVLGIGLRFSCLQASILPTDISSQAWDILILNSEYYFEANKRLLGWTSSFQYCLKFVLDLNIHFKIVSSGHWCNPINFNLSFWLYHSHHWAESSSWNCDLMAVAHLFTPSYHGLVDLVPMDSDPNSSSQTPQ